MRMSTGLLTTNPVALGLSTRAQSAAFAGCFRYLQSTPPDMVTERGAFDLQELRSPLLVASRDAKRPTYEIGLELAQSIVERHW